MKGIDVVLPKQDIIRRLSSILNWDYGKNGKGYYNDIFAPGWTVASLWELFSPGRAEKFLKK